MRKKLIKGVNDFASRNPDMLDNFDYEKNEKKPDEIFACGTERVFMICKNGHSYLAAAHNLTLNHSGCPYCSRSNAHLIKGQNDLLTCFPEIAAEWNYEKNGDLKPTDVTKASNKKVWWICPEGHEYEAPINSRTQNGTGCPICSGKMVLTGFNDLKTTHPKIASEWDYERNGNLRPSDVSKGSNKMVGWKCAKGHKWKATPNSRTERNSGCPICSGRQVLAGFNDLLTTHPEIAAEWDYEKNGDLKPSEVTCGSNKKVWWKCSKEHEWQAKVENRTGQGQGCPECRSLRRSPVIICLENGKIYKNPKEACLDFGFKDNKGIISTCVRGKRKTAFGLHWRLATEEEKASIGLVETANEKTISKKIQFDSNRSDAYNKMAIDKISQAMMPGEGMEASAMA